MSGPSSTVAPGDYSATSVRDAGHSAPNAELDGTGGWCPAVAGISDWVQVDLSSVVRIEGIITQGSSDEDSWFTSYTIFYSEDNVVFVPYEVGGVAKVGR